MTQKLFQVVENPGSSVIARTEDRTTSSMTAAINPGEPLKTRTAQNSAATDLIPVGDGDPEIATDDFIGISNSKSTEAAVTTEGKVEVICCENDTVIRGKATTSGNIDTQAEIDLLLFAWVTFDLTALTGTNGDFTVDEDETLDTNVNGLQIRRGDPVLGTLDVRVHAMVINPYIA